MRIKVDNKFILLTIIFLFFIKVVLFILIKNNYLTINLGGGNDADYYDQFANGFQNIEVNVWPVILKTLNHFGLYSRSFISNIFLFLNMIAIPAITCKLAGLKFNRNQKSYLYLYLLCLVYPTLFYYSFDIYRDVFMVYVFLIGCLTVKKFSESKAVYQLVFYYILSIFVGCFLVLLRPYLGYAFILALLMWKIKLTKKRVIFLGVMYLFVLFLASYIGILDFLIKYRSTFEEMDGASNLGLDFSNSLMFVPNLALSILGQLFGLYIVNSFAAIIFIIETVPFIYMLIYVIKNIKIADNFLRFLIIFFVIYASVWLIGNDNLGTALRLRMYNYLAIYICFFHIIKVKSLSKSNKLRSSYL